MISAINHITLSVRNLETSFDFYTNILGLRPVARWYNGAYLEAGGDWVCLNVDPDVRSTALAEYTHTAFTVSQSDFPILADRLHQFGAVCWQQNRSPGESHYFLDPDGHKLEIHTSTLADRMRAMTHNPPKDLILFDP